VLLNPDAQFTLARRLRRGEVTLGEVFTFLSGLYFRGKLAYAAAFANPPAGVGGSLVITSSCGLLDASSPVDPGLLRSFADVPIDEGDARYRAALRQGAVRLRAVVDGSCEIVLLGSIATGKYVDVLLEIFGERLRFPIDFVGRGDMSRGGLLLRCAADRTELIYGPIHGAIRKGRRPAKLPPRPKGG
jgi:hypothetical protein